MSRRRARTGRFGDGEAVGTSGCKRITPAGKAIQVCAKWAKPGAQMRGPADACKALRGAAQADRESFYAIHVDARNRVIGVEEVAKGTLSSVEVHPREVFKSAILSNASAIFIAHNHPSGDPEPSQQDIGLTERLASAGQLLGIPVRDHVIVAAEGCTSLRDRYGDSTIKFGYARDGGRRRRPRALGAAAPACPKRKGLSVHGAFWLGVAASIAANVVTAVVGSAIAKARSQA